MNSCYIIYSKTLDRFYTGVCHSDLEARLEKHNSHAYGNHRYTAKAKDWRLFHVIRCKTFSQARKIENHIKRMKSRVYISNLKKYPEISIKLQERYNS